MPFPSLLLPVIRLPRDRPSRPGNLRDRRFDIALATQQGGILGGSIVDRVCRDILTIFLRAEL